MRIKKSFFYPLIKLLSFCQFISCIFIFFIPLTSCTTLPPSPIPAHSIPWKMRETLLSQIKIWQIQGKIAAQTAQDSGSATLTWLQNHDHFNISLQGPFGSSNVKLIGQPGFVMLQTPEGKKVTAKSAEQLLAQQWRFNVPISHLNYWIRGLPVPGIAAATQLDAYGRLTMLNQQGFSVQFLSYVPVKGIELPNKINIHSNGLKVKIMIYQWKT